MLLGVNIDHVATIRNARGGFEPDVFQAAKTALSAGASSITMHLREDRRHIKDEDIYKVSQIDNIKLNLEMAAAEDIQKIALDIKPYACCIVPEKRKEITTEGGLDVASQTKFLKDFIKPLLDSNINVSLFIDADFNQIDASVETGAKFIELHTGKYANSFGTPNEEKEFQALKQAAQYAQSLGLTVNAGHGLNYDNVNRMHDIKGLYELNIGHTIISRAIFTGLNQAVIDMRNLII